ncbi:MAG: NAD(P)/FAD-dependent oxidoreductase [Gemmatimonadaceae bacterium]|nr:NAD(P)/FAD-dependent oxidoreductase [Gemmatimonadaceae bacterium]
MMQRDELAILAHKVAPGQFDLAASLSYISLKDQAVRARNLLSSMDRENMFTKDPHVLVVGAGFAGVNAALWFAHRGIRVDLIDRETAPFSVQRNCMTRHVSITQYEWPAPPYAQHQYPVNGVGAYAWTAMCAPPGYLTTSLVQSAHDHVLDWTAQLARAPTMLCERYGTEVVGRPHTYYAGKRKQIAWTEVKCRDLQTGDVTMNRYRFVFYAVGFGHDMSGVPISVSPPPQAPLYGILTGRTVVLPAFWSNDQVAARLDSTSVLISGGGDGALQDFVRAVVKRNLVSSTAVLDALMAALVQNAQAVRRVPDVERAWSTLHQQLAAAELQASRAAPWTSATAEEVWTLELTRFSRHLV